MEPTCHPAPGLQAALCVPGPGQLGRNGAPGSMLFAAGAMMATMDLVAAFFAYDIDHMDWLTDFLTGMELNDLVDMLEDRPEDEELELAYNKSDLVTVPSDSGWADPQ